MELSVVIPSYLEEENLRVLLPRIKKVVEELNVPHEILIIDTITSMDNTEVVCKDFGANYIHREQGNKYGDAVRTGLKYARGNYILFMDADGSHSPEFITTLYLNRQGNDVVIASRYVDGGGSDNTNTLIFMSWAVNFIYSWFFDLQCKDVSNSFKLYSGAMISGINLKCNEFDTVEEILIKLKRKNRNLRILEIPYVFKSRMFGHTKRNLLLFALSYLYTLFRLKFRE
jgi:dolichol-phosphate mannosyltransferase